MINLYMLFFSWESPNYFPKRPNHFTFHQQCIKSPISECLMPTFVIFWFGSPQLRNWTQATAGKCRILTTRPPENSPCPFIVAILVGVVLHSGFDLHFPKDYWCSVSFNVLIDYLDIFFGMSIQVNCSLLNCIVNIKKHIYLAI